MAALRPIDLYLQLTSGKREVRSPAHFGELKLNTPLKTNMSVENQWLEDVFPIEIVPFRGHVSFRGGVNVTEKADIFFVAIEKKHLEILAHLVRWWLGCIITSEKQGI